MAVRCAGAGTGRIYRLRIVTSYRIYDPAEGSSFLVLVDELQCRSFIEGKNLMPESHVLVELAKANSAIRRRGKFSTSPDVVELEVQ